MKTKREGIVVTGIHLSRIGDHIVVAAEINGRWVDVIREGIDGSFSHIVEVSDASSASVAAIHLKHRSHSTFVTQEDGFTDVVCLDERSTR